MYDERQTTLCKPISIESRGPVDRLREQLADAKARVERLEALLRLIDAQPQVAELLNEIGKNI